MGTAATPRSPILSLTVLDADSLVDGVVAPDSMVLAVSRSAEANPTHPNVVSVPTQRIPARLFAAIEETAEELGTGPEPGVSYFRGGSVDSGAINGHHPTVFAVEALLARKLGLAEDMERGRSDFRAALRARVAGVALYDNLGEADVYEPVEMLNVIVALRLADVRLPIATGSYSMMAWVEVDSFLAGVESRDPTRLSPRFDPIAFCVHGVCLQAAQASLEHLRGRPPFPDHDPEHHADTLYAAPRTRYLMAAAGGAEAVDAARRE